jgi:hypothetical protein
MLHVDVSRHCSELPVPIYACYCHVAIPFMVYCDPIEDLTMGALVYRRPESVHCSIAKVGTFRSASDKQGIPHHQRAVLLTCVLM